MGLKQNLVNAGPIISMVMVQVSLTGMQLLSRVILNQGTFVFALMTYRHIVAAVSIAPFAFFLERDMLKKVTWSAFGWLFVSGLFGISLAQGLFYYGLRDTTASYATNFLNMVPIVTFGFSVIFKLEKLGLRTRAGKVKSIGTLLCVGGALTYSLYHGKAFHLRPSQHNHPSHTIINHTKAHWMRGTFMLVGNCLSLSAWFLVQVKLGKVYPSKYWATVFTCLISSVQSMVIGVAIDRSKASWKLGWDLQLVTIFYSGILASGATFCVMMWVVKKRGPCYPPMFNPLSLIFVSITEALIFGEAITVGGILGMFMIIAGLYAFLWGKKKESASRLAQVNAMNSEESVGVREMQSIAIAEAKGTQSRQI